MKKIVLLLACAWLIGGGRMSAYAQFFVEYDFHSQGQSWVSGSIYLDALFGSGDSVTNVVGWNIMADGLTWTPATSYINLDSGWVSGLSWDNSTVTSGAIQLVANDSAPSWPSFYGPQVLNIIFDQTSVTDGPGGGLQSGDWVVPAPEPQTVTLLLVSILVWGGWRCLRGRCIQPGKY